MAVQHDILNQFAQSVIDRRFADARALLAPWLRDQLDETALEAALDRVIATAAEQSGIEDARWPTEFSTSDNEIDLAELRRNEEVDSEVGRLSDSITDANFRSWHCVTFNPDSDDNVTLDLWIATVVDDQGDLRVGHVSFLTGD
jgi:hypothetical protein